MTASPRTVPQRCAAALCCNAVPQRRAATLCRNAVFDFVVNRDRVPAVVSRRGPRTSGRFPKAILYLFDEKTIHLKEFPTPVILDQARERAVLNGKICNRFSDEDCGLPYPFASGETDGTDR